MIIISSSLDWPHLGSFAALFKDDFSWELCLFLLLYFFHNKNCWKCANRFAWTSFGVSWIHSWEGTRRMEQDTRQQHKKESAAAAGDDVHSLIQPRSDPGWLEVPSWNRVNVDSSQTESIWRLAPFFYLPFPSFLPLYRHLWCCWGTASLGITNRKNGRSFIQCMERGSRWKAYRKHKLRLNCLKYTETAVMPLPMVGCWRREKKLSESD